MNKIVNENWENIILVPFLTSDTVYHSQKVTHLITFTWKSVIFFVTEFHVFNLSSEKNFFFKLQVNFVHWVYNLILSNDKSLLSAILYVLKRHLSVTITWDEISGAYESCRTLVYNREEKYHTAVIVFDQGHLKRKTWNFRMHENNNQYFNTSTFVTLICIGHCQIY